MPQQNATLVGGGGFRLYSLVWNAPPNTLRPPLLPGSVLSSGSKSSAPSSGRLSGRSESGSASGASQTSVTSSAVTLKNAERPGDDLDRHEAPEHPETRHEVPGQTPERLTETADGAVARFEQEGEQLAAEVALSYGAEPDAELISELGRLSAALHGERDALVRSLKAEPGPAVDAERETPPAVRERFGEILTPAELEQSIGSKVAPVLERSLRMDDAVFARCEQLDVQAFGQVDVEDPDARQLSGYLELLRQGFTKADLRTLRAAADVGGPEVAKAYAELVNRERQSVGEYVERNRLVERCRDGIAQLDALYREAGVADIRPVAPTVQFMGKYEVIALQLSYEEGTPEHIPYFLGDAIQLKNRNAVMVSFRDEVLSGEGPSVIGPDDLMHLTVHEVVHSHDFSASVEGGNDFSMSEAHTFKGGFMAGNRSNRRRPGALMGLNEGMTELAARVATNRLGYRRSEAAGPHSYDGYVADVAALVDVLEHRPTHEGFDPSRYDGKALRGLLELYQSPKGTLELGRRMHREIGPKALSLLEALSGGGFADFLRQLERFRAGQQPSPVEVHPDGLAQVGLKLEELQATYPFLVAKKPAEFNWENF